MYLTIPSLSPALEQNKDNLIAVEEEVT